MVVVTAAATMVAAAAMSGPRRPYCQWRRARMPEILLQQSGCLGAVAAQLSEFLSLRMKVPFLFLCLFLSS